MICKIYQQNAAPLPVLIVELKLRQYTDTFNDFNYERKTYTISPCEAKQLGFLFICVETGSKKKGLKLLMIN